jgi:hypothetical protein
MNTFFSERNSVLDGNYSKSFGLGFESELIQRAAKAQIIQYLPLISEELEDIWSNRDKEFCEQFGLAYRKLQIPKVKVENIRAGLEVISLIKAPLEVWPTILIYSRNGLPYQIQEDQFDTSSYSLCIEILCYEGPVVNEEEVHGKEGLEVMESLDKQVHRLSDAVYLCIQKDPTLSGSIGQIEKPPKVNCSLPWARKQEGQTDTGQTYIFQGNQFNFTVQKFSY